MCCAPIASRPCSDTLTVHIPTFLYIFHEMFFTTKMFVLLKFRVFNIRGSGSPMKKI